MKQSIPRSMYILKYLFVLTIFLTAFACKGPVATEEAVQTEKQEVLPPLSDTLNTYFSEKVKTFAQLGKRRMVFKIGKPGEAVSYYGYDGRGDSLITQYNINYEIGSNTKMFTATSILQLIEAGHFSLDTPFTEIIPNETLYEGLLIVDGKNYVDSVTVRNLLNHTSGMADYFKEGSDEAEFLKNGDASLVFTIADLVNLSKENTKDRFVPGSKWEYSNVNYALLGEIIKKVSGKTYNEYIQEHILDPLGMEHTYFGSFNPPSEMEQAHFKGEKSEMPYTMAGAAGDIISTLDDMFVFIDAWYVGKLFKNPETLKMVLNENYREMGSGMTYGLGVINLSNQSWGHEGQTFGFQAYAAALPNGYRFVGYMDDASSFPVGMWTPAMAFSGRLSMDSE